MTVKELISKKNYDYISFRMAMPSYWPDPDEFWGCCRSENGKLIPLDGDIYSDDGELVSWEEWSKPEEDIMNGLTVVEKGEWY